MHKTNCFRLVETASFQALAGIVKLSLVYTDLYLFPCITSQFAFKRIFLLPKVFLTQHRAGIYLAPALRLRPLKLLHRSLAL